MRDSADGASTRVAFVLPVYNERASLPAFHAELSRVFADSDAWSHEFIYVNDGSTDGSLELLAQLRSRDSRVTTVNLARNFGHQTAVTVGLDLAHEAGVDVVAIMDTDLQDPPSVAREMLERWAEGPDVIYAQRRTRQDTMFKRTSANGFYWLLQKLADTKIPRNAGDFRVLDRRVLAEVVRYREHDRYLRGIVAQVGFRQEAHLFDRDERFAGSSHYPLRKMLGLAAAGIFGFSTFPLRVITRIGVYLSIAALVYGSYVVIHKLVEPSFAVPGWTMIMAALMLFSGAQLLSLGMIGSYVGRTYLEVLDRPLYSIESVSRGQQ